MGWFDGLAGLFSNEQNTTNKSSQTGTTQNNLWDNPDLQQFLSQYNQQFSGPNISQVQADPNAYMYGAANNQQGLGAGLAPAFGTAGNIAATGLNPASIAAFQNPHTQQVVDATQRDFDVQNQRSLQNVSSNAAMRGALGNSNTEVAKALALESNRRQQDPVIAGLRSQGFNTAAGLAGQSAGLQLQGSGQLGQLTGVASGVNQGQFGMGEGIRQAGLQSQMLPYQLYQQGIQGYQGLGNLAGSTTSGTSTGTSNTTQTPSTGSIFAGLAGTALSAFSDERVKENIKPIGETYDGQPIYKYNLKGSPKTQIGLMAQDVEVRDPESVGSLGGIKTVDYDRATRAAERFSSGGMVPTNETSSPNSLHEKVGAAYRMLQGLSKASGGSVKGYDAGGWVTNTTPHNGGPDSNSSYWDGIKDQAIANPTGAQGSPLGKLGSGLSSMGKDMGSMDGLGDGGLGAQQSALSQMLTGLGKGFATGGAPSGGLGYTPAEWSDNAPVFKDEPEAPSFAGAAPRESNKGSSFFSGLADTLSNIPKPFSGGVWAGEQATPMQRFGAALTQIGNGPFAGVGQHIIAQQKNRLEEQQAERLAQQLMRQATQFRTQHDLDRQRFDESKRHNLATEDRAANQFERQLELDEAKIGKLEVPEVVRQVEAMGLPRGTPEHQAEVRRLLSKDKLEGSIAIRTEEAIKLGLDPNVEPGRTYVLTGKMPREDQQPLTATDKKAILEADEMVQSNTASIDALRQAKELSKQANAGWFASSRGMLGRNLPDLMVPDAVSSPESSSATANYENLVIGQALAQLKSTFGAAPTEGERKILMDLQASVGLPDADRQKILDRAMKAAERRLEFNKRRSEELRGGAFYKPKAPGAPTGTPTEAPADPLGIR